MEVLDLVAAVEPAAVDIFPVHRGVLVQQDVSVHVVGAAQHAGLEVGRIDDLQLHGSLDRLTGTKHPAVDLKPGVLLGLFPVGYSALQRMAVIYLGRQVQWPFLRSEDILEPRSVWGRFAVGGRAYGCRWVVFGNDS